MAFSWLFEAPRTRTVVAMTGAALALWESGGYFRPH